MARDFKGGLKIAVYARTVLFRRFVEPEGVIKCPPALSRKASVHAATFSHFRHIEPSGGWFGHRRGGRPRPAWAVCGGCRLKAAFPDRVRRPRSVWLLAEGRQALGPAWPQPAAPPMHRPAAQAVGSRLARTKLDLGRGRWI